MCFNILSKTISINGLDIHEIGECQGLCLAQIAILIEKNTLIVLWKSSFYCEYVIMRKCWYL